MRALSQKHQVTVLVCSMGHSNERLADLTVEVYPESVLSRLRISTLSLFGRRAKRYDWSFPSLRFLFGRLSKGECDIAYVRQPKWLYAAVQFVAFLRGLPLLYYVERICPATLSLQDRRVFPLIVASNAKTPATHRPPNFIPLTIDLTRDFGDDIYPPYRAYGDAPLRLMHVGKLIERKGQEIVFEALSVLVAQGLNVQLSMYSHAHSRSFRQSMFEILSRLGISKHVEFMPPKNPNEMLKEYRKYHVFVYSGYESSPRRDPDSATYGRADGKCGTRLYSLIEAMAAGLPVVCATDHHVVGAVEKDANGLLFEKGDALDLAEKIQQISRMDLVAMGARSRALVEAHHNAKDFPARFERLLEQSVS